MWFFKKSLCWILKTGPTFLCISHNMHIKSVNIFPVTWNHWWFTEAFNKDIGNGPNRKGTALNRANCGLNILLVIRVLCIAYIPCQMANNDLAILRSIVHFWTIYRTTTWQKSIQGGGYVNFLGTSFGHCGIAGKLTQN